MISANKILISIAIVFNVMFYDEGKAIPKILMVGATPTESSISTDRSVLLDSKRYDTWFLDNLITEPVPKNCFKGDFNNKGFMAGIVNSHKKFFDYVVIDFSVAKFMRIHTLESLITLLKPSCSLFIQGIGGLHSLPDKFCDSEEDFDKACEQYFKEHFAKKDSLLYASIPYIYSTSAPRDENALLNWLGTPDGGNYKKLCEEKYRSAFVNYCRDELNCICEYSSGFPSGLVPSEIESTIHPAFKQFFPDEYLYKITPINELQPQLMTLKTSLQSLKTKLQLLNNKLIALNGILK